MAGAVPTNGLGPNVLLQDNPLVAFHPPLLYLGLVGFTLPFAFAVASLVTGRVDDDWQGETRRWTLFAWAFLTVGILLGAWWSYQVLGWGGFWAWDPVENASLLPWLVGDRLPALGDGPAAPRAAADLEPLAGHRHLQPHHPRHLPHPLGCDPVRPLLLRPRPSGPCCSGSSAWWWSPASGSSPGAATGCARRGHRLAGQPGGRLPGQQPALRGLRLRRPARHGLPAALRGAPRRPAGDRGRPLLQPAWSSRSGWPCSSSWRWPRRCRGGRPRWRPCAAGWRCRPPSGSRSWRPASLAGVRGVEPLLAFGLGGFAAATAGRALVLSVRGAWRAARAAGAGAVRAALAAWRGLVGRANGGMVVHIGVVVVAVALSAAAAFRHDGLVLLHRGQAATVAGHRIEFVGTRTSTHAVPLRAPGRAAGRRRRRVHAGHHPVRRRHPDRGHAGHRLELAGRRLPHHRQCAGPGDGVAIPGGGAAPGGLAVDRRGPRRASARSCRPCPAAGGAPPTRCRPPCSTWPASRHRTGTHADRVRRPTGPSPTPPRSRSERATTRDGHTAGRAGPPPGPLGGRRGAGDRGRAGGGAGHPAAGHRHRGLQPAGGQGGPRRGRHHRRAGRTTRCPRLRAATR